MSVYEFIIYMTIVIGVIVVAIHSIDWLKGN